MTKSMTIEMPEEMYAEIAKYAAEDGGTVEAYILQVLEQFIEDVEDIAVAEAELARIEKEGGELNMAKYLGIDDD